MIRHVSPFATALVSGGMPIGVVAVAGDFHRGDVIALRLASGEEIRMDPELLSLRADPRYHLLETVRQYAREKLQDAGEGARIARHGGAGIERDELPFEAMRIEVYQDQEPRNEVIVMAAAPSKL